MTSMMGHNGPPADRTFKKRWARALFSVDRKPYGAIAMAFKLYTEMDSQGRGATISDDEFRDSCGVSDGSCRVFKKWLVENEFIRIEVRGQRGRKSTFQAVIPGEIPAASDAIQNEIPAPNTGSFDEYRQPSPAVETGIPATADGINRPAAYSAAIPVSRAPACLESSLREDSYTLQVVSEGEEGADAPPSRDALTAFELWNELAQRVGLPLARTLTPQRRKSILARMREHGGLDAWRTALGHVERSAFLQGTNDRGWRADLDFMLQASRFTKLVEGGYGNGAHAKPKESNLERLDRLMGGSEPPQRRLTP
jgi:hypothetical protein